MKPLDVFTKAYIEAALWSSNDNSDESGGEPLDKNYGLDDIAEETLEEMVRDCENFQRENEKYIPVDLLSNAGHDFWLTRNGHGAGFWDGDWPDRAGYRLTASAKSYGEKTLYVGDDGKIYAV